jgi:hypothetical protein
MLSKKEDTNQVVAHALMMVMIVIPHQGEEALRIMLVLLTRYDSNNSQSAQTI